MPVDARFVAQEEVVTGARPALGCLVVPPLARWNRAIVCVDGRLLLVIPGHVALRTAASKPIESIVAVLVQNCFRSLLIHICLCLASVVAFLDLYLVFLVFCPPYVCLFFVFYLSVNVSLNSYVLVHVLFCMMFGVYG